jgi:hypothetical protein
MRMILAALSERAAADRRKCCAMLIAQRKPTRQPWWHRRSPGTILYFRNEFPLVVVAT